MNNIRPLPSNRVGDIPVPELRFGGPVTLSEQIAEWLRARIWNREFEPDADALPSETTLTQLFPVSRDTVRRAIEILRDEGLVYTIAQRGTFVRAGALGRLARPQRTRGGQPGRPGGKRYLSA